MSFEAKKKAIVDKPRIVNAIVIDHQHAHDRTEIHQMVPVSPISGQAGSLDTENGPDSATTHTCHELLEAGPCDDA